jgi:hypothetical protein
VSTTGGRESRQMPPSRDGRPVYASAVTPPRRRSRRSRRSPRKTAPRRRW